MSKAEQIRQKYGKDRKHVPYWQIAEEFGVVYSTAWEALNKYKGVGAGSHNMDKETLKRFSRAGGIAVHKKGVGHEFTSEESKNIWNKRKNL